MKNKLSVLLSLILLAFAPGCKFNSQPESLYEEPQVDDSIDTIIVKLPVEDTILTSFAKLYAGVSTSNIQLTPQQRAAWEYYSKIVSYHMERSFQKIRALDTLSRNDFSDIHKKTKTVFYPFGGPDLFYPLTIFPDAESYCLTGLEPAGTILNSLRGNGTNYYAFLKAQSNFFTWGYFITKDMFNDLKGNEVNGTAPLYSMQLGALGYSIESAGYKVISDAGALVDTTAVTDVVEFSVFKEGDQKSKKIVYIRTNLKDGFIPENFLAYISRQDSCSTSVFVKAASYLLSYIPFSTMRDHVLSHSCAIIQDDTGIPYRYLNNENWDISLYGQYMHPLPVFGEYCHQPDLERVFKEKGSRQLPVRMGYNRLPNLIVCRKIE